MDEKHYIKYNIPGDKNTQQIENIRNFFNFLHGSHKNT